MLTQIISETLLILIQLIILIIGGVIIQYVREKIGEENFQLLYSLSKTVVIAVEQSIGAGHGADKKQEALQTLRNLTRGKLTEEQLERMIEAAVYEMNRTQKRIPV